MKKQFFSIVMMLALVIVAGSAMGQTKSTPYPGGTYNYTVSDIKAFSGGTVTITYSGSGASFSDISTLTIGANASTNLTFKTTYSTSPTAGQIRVAITEATGACVNFIEMDINPVALPSFAVSITTTTDASICQATTNTPANVTAASVGQTNTINYSVTPNVTNVLSGSTYTYTYTIDLTESGLDAYQIAFSSGTGNSSCTPSSSSSFIVSGSGTGVGTGTTELTPDAFTITFNTTTGIAPTTIPGAITAPSITITETAGTLTKAGTTSTADPVEVKSLPSIGSFN